MESSLLQYPLKHKIKWIHKLNKMQKKNKACVISQGEDYWLVRTSMRLRIFTKTSGPRCDKSMIGTHKSNYIPGHQTMRNNNDNKEVTPTN